MKKNIFWFIIDSVRSYRSGLDDRDRLEIMDEFARDSIEFKNCFTSAPSSLLAAGSLFTGLPAVFVSPHFNDWKFVDPGITTIGTLVKEHGYQSIPLIDAREGREKYQEMLPPFPAKFLPKNYHLSDYAWSNMQLTEVFENIIKNHAKPPFAFVFWYDCRRDPNTSNHVKKALNLIKEQGYYNDSIIVMNSDHGYPDPKTSLDENFFKNRGHDMILTDDNIRTPLIIKYPESPKGKVISNVVGHADILPTILDILKLPMNKKYDKMELRGKSLLNIIDNGERDERVVRTDTRLRMDNNRIVSYRSAKYKFIKFQDENQIVLHDLINDPNELTNISNFEQDKIADVINNFKKIDNFYEKKLMENQVEKLEKNFIKVASKLKGLAGQSIRIVIITPAPIDLINILLVLMKNIFNIKHITLVNTGSVNIDNIDNVGIDEIITTKNINDAHLDQINQQPTDLLIYLTHNSRRVYLKSEIVKYIGKIKSNKKILMNYNFEIFDYFSFLSLFSYIKLFFDFERKWFFYKQEPRYFLVDAWFYFTYSIKYYFKKKRKQKQAIDGDIMTAREVLAYRNYHLKAKLHGLSEMKSDEMQYETERIKDWGKE